MIKFFGIVILSEGSLIREKTRSFIEGQSSGVDLAFDRIERHVADGGQGFEGVCIECQRSKK